MSVGGKVLRIAQIEGGSIRSERLIPHDETVTIGSSRDCTFQVHHTDLGRSFAVFRRSPDGTLVLRHTQAFDPRSKVSSGKEGRLLTLDTPDADGVCERELSVTDRGKLRIGSTTLLFQFVVPPRIPARIATPVMDFRPRLIEPEDTIYLGFLGLQSALALVLSVFVWNAEAPNYTLETTHEHIAQFHLPPAPTVLEPVEVVADVVTPKAKPVAPKVPTPEKVAQTHSVTPRSPSPRTPEQIAQGRAAAKEKMINRMSGIMKIGTSGKGELTGGQFFDGSAPGRLELDGVRVVADGMGSAGGLRGSGTDGGTMGAAVVDGLQTTGPVGSSEIGGGPQTIVSASVSLAEPGTTSSDSDTVKTVVRRYAGQMKYCYERSLKRDGSLGGRVELGWSLEEGRVVDAYVAANGTGDAELAACMVQKLSRWRFVGAADGEVSWPFVFSSK